MPRHPGGRPTDYTEEILDLAQDYVDNCPDNVPTIVGLCKHIGRGSTTVYVWRDDPEKAEFRDILLQVMDNQHCELVNKGLIGEFNPAVTKMILTKHGYSEKIQQEVSGPNGGAINNKYTVEFVNATPKG